MESLHEIVREAEDNYVNGNTELGKYVSHSLYDTVETIYAYLNSKHISGRTDSLGREKPFFNIVTAARNIWYRATDIDRKDIKFIPQTESSVVLAFVANVLLQKWMDENRFGQFLNQWGKTLADYGSAVVKFVERGGKLSATVVPWSRLVPDSVDFYSIPTIEKFYMTPQQLRQNKFYDQEVVNKLIDRAMEVRKTMEGQQKDNQDHFIEIYEIHGELDSRFLQDNPNEQANIKYVQQMHVIAYLESKENGFDDFVLYKGKEAKHPYMITHLIEEDGRTLSIGAVENLFDAQWMENHTVKNMKDTLDISSKLIFQTADSRYVGRNVLSAIETGDIFIHEDNKPLTRIANDKPNISALQNFGIMWQNLGQEITNTPDLTRGITQAQPLTFGLGQIVNNNSNSLFEQMTENKGLALEDIMKEYVIPFIKKKLNNNKEVMAILDDAGINEIDALYIPKEAVNGFNSRSIDAILNGEMVVPFNREIEEQSVRESLAPLGNKRSFVVDKMGKKTWAELLSDFEWDNIKVEVTNENTDKVSVLQTLSAVLQTIAGNPQILQDPNARVVFNAILRETGAISSIQLTNAQAKPQPIQAGAAEELEKLPANNET